MICCGKISSFSVHKIRMLCLCFHFPISKSNYPLTITRQHSYCLPQKLINWSGQFLNQVLRLSNGKLMKTSLVLDAMGNFSPIVRQVRNLMPHNFFLVHLVLIFFNFRFFMTSVLHILQ